MVGRMVLSAICREIFSRVDIPEHQRNPVRLYVDEFEHFGSADFETILAEGRRFKLSLVLAHQTLAQLSTKMRSLILGNVGVKFVFRCGREDGATLSKDVCGDPKGFEFADMPTGEAVLWRRGLGDIHIEINEPIIEASSPFAAQKQAFIQDVYARSTGARRVQAEHIQKPPGHPISTPAATASGITGDWLCD